MMGFLEMDNETEWDLEGSPTLSTYVST